MMVISCHLLHINHHLLLRSALSIPKSPNPEIFFKSFFGILLVDYFRKSTRTKRRVKKMESISISKKEFGLFIGVFTAVIAVVALFAGKAARSEK